MKGAVATVKHEFSGLRTGRASVGLLDPVQVDAYGSNMPLAQVGTVMRLKRACLRFKCGIGGLVVASIRRSAARPWTQSAGRRPALRIPIPP